MNSIIRFAFLGIPVILIAAIAYGEPIAVSTFDTCNDDWRVVSDGEPPYDGEAEWSDVGGPSGGFIYDTDMDNGVWAFQAPEKFLGDVSDAYGQHLSFDFFADKIGPDHDNIRIALSKLDGYGIIALVPSPDSPGQVAHRDVPLDLSQAWYTFDYFSGAVGGLATATQIEGVLSELGYLLLGAELWDGYDMPDEVPPVVGELVAYDNIVLMPEPTMFGLIVLGGLLAAKRRR